MKSIITCTEDHIEQEFKEINRLTDRGQLKKALKLCEALFEIYPEHPRVLHGVGMLRYRTGEDRKEAEQLIYRAIELKPDFADAYHSRGVMFHNAVLQKEAEELFRKVLDYEPDHYKAMTSLATVLITQDQAPEALSLCNKALKLNPDYAPIYHNLGNIMQGFGQAEEAVKYLKKSLAITKQDSAYSCLLFVMNLIPSFSQQDIYNESSRWGRRHLKNALKHQQHLNSRHPERRIRIGYVSGDLKMHPVTFHFKPVLTSHNKRHVEIFLYNSFPHADELTEELAECADVYRDISALSDEKSETLIRQDGIDILVDLAGHTGFHRLGLFSRKAAPIQVTWLGYFNTTGLASIDYIISDPITIPPDHDRYFTEQVFRLPDCRFCYQPIANAPPISATPALRNGHLTFGSFNNIHKITPQVIAVWSRLLLSIPDSRLILKSKSFKNETVTEDFIAKFVRHGVKTDSIELRLNSPYTDMLSEYCDIDIALDTFPYNGGATTCEALWMGVPVVSLAGGTPISRQSKAFLFTIGYPEWVATTADEYVEIISRLTSDINLLQSIRTGLRQKMADSPLCDGNKFTVHLETAYRQMWQRWCSDVALPVTFRRFSTDELCAAGVNYLKDGEVQSAFDMFNRVLRRNSRHLQALNGLAKVYQNNGDYSSATKTFRRAIRKDPTHFYSYFNLGFMLLNSAKFKEARTEFLHALECDPDHVETFINLCICSRLLSRLEEAQRYAEKALDLSPDHATALGSLAFVLGDQGNIAGALEMLNKALELEPESLVVLTGIIPFHFYDTGTRQKEILELSKRIGFVISKTCYPESVVQRSYESKEHLRIGFVSPDFCYHPVGQLLVALFKEFDPERLSLYCYSNGLIPDPWTEWYQSRATAWRSIVKTSDRDAAELISHDRIDILVDLSGHTIGNRLPIFGLYPAPIQVSWIGYGHTTGMDSIDYIIADDDFIRPQDEQWFSEQVMRLPHSRFCFVPPAPSPEVVEPPFLDNKYITFGSFNNPMKLSEQVVAAWARILLSVPRSRLILKYKAYKDMTVRNRYYNLFAKHGVVSSRIEFRKNSIPFLMMAEYGEIDIALDPFPFTGGMTSLISLWMGVPVVTMSGELPVSRQTESFLKLVGLKDLVAFNEEKYIATVINLAQNPEKLCEIRSTLRDTMATSPLCDAKAHAVEVEHAFFEMWRMKMESTQKHPEVSSDGL